MQLLGVEDILRMGNTWLDLDLGLGPSCATRLGKRRRYFSIQSVVKLVNFQRNVPWEPRALGARVWLAFPFPRQPS